MPFNALGIVVADEAAVGDRVVNDELLVEGVADDCSPASLANVFRSHVGREALLGSVSRRFKMFRDREMQQPMTGMRPIFGPDDVVSDINVFLLLQGPRVPPGAAAAGGRDTAPLESALVGAASEGSNVSHVGGGGGGRLHEKHSWLQTLASCFGSARSASGPTSVDGVGTGEGFVEQHSGTHPGGASTPLRRGSSSSATTSGSPDDPRNVAAGGHGAQLAATGDWHYATWAEAAGVPPAGGSNSGGLPGGVGQCSSSAGAEPAATIRRRK